MGINTNSEIRRLQLELNQARNEIEILQTTQTAGQTQEASQPVPTSTPIINLIRNGDHSHSQGTWFLGTSSGDDNEECANVYTHEKESSVRIADGAITATDKTLTSASNPFVSGDAGKRIIVYGAGTSGGDLVTTIASYTNAGEVELTDAAATTVSNATVRLRLQKLEKTNNFTNPSATATDILKSTAHTDFATNIQDPQWDKTNGAVLLGSTNSVDYPFGYYKYVQGGGTGNGTDFIALHPLFPGRTVYARINAARDSEYVKPSGYMNFGIYNNDDDALEFAKGADFELTASVVGTPSATTTAYYYLVIETDQNYSIVSQVKTLVNAPDNSSFTPSSFVALSWNRYAGALRQKIYRKLGSGNVFLLETDETGKNDYLDTNPATRIDTGSTSFPNPANARSAVTSLVSTSTNALEDLPVDGTDTWREIEAYIPFPSSVNLGKFSDPFLRIFLSQDCDLQITDAVTNSTTTVTSAAGQFTADHVGLSVTVSDDTHTLTTTIATYVDANTVTLTAAPSWTSTGNTLTITSGAPNGLHFDLTGAAFLRGEWSPHTEDFNNRPQTVTSNPNGSSQGSTTGGGTTGGTVLTCFLSTALVAVYGTDGVVKEIPANELKRGMRVFFGEHGKYNTITQVNKHIVDRLYYYDTEHGICPVTPSHRFATDDESVANGRSAADITDKLLYFNGETFIMSDVVRRVAATGSFNVVSISLDGQGRTKHLFLVNGFRSHNRKQDPDILT